jgi:hypothetical protein
VSRYALNKAMYEGPRPENHESVLSGKSRFVSGFDLDDAERAALSGPDFGALLELGGLPNLVYRYYRLHGHGFTDFTATLARGRAGG